VFLTQWMRYFEASTATAGGLAIRYARRTRNGRPSAGKKRRSPLSERGSFSPVQKNCFQQSREESVNFSAPQLIHVGCAIVPGMNQPSFTQHTEMVGHAGFRPVPVQGVTGRLPFTIKLANDIQPHWIAERIENTFQFNVLRSRMLEGSHRRVLIIPVMYVYSNIVVLMNLIQTALEKGISMDKRKGVSRRVFLTTAGAAAMLPAVTGTTRADTVSQDSTPTGSFEVVAEFYGPRPSGIVVTPDGLIFVGFPRHANNHKEATLAELKNGKLVPFPNAGMSLPSDVFPEQRLVSVHGMTLDSRGRIWAIDDGKLAGQPIAPGAAKIVGFDPSGGHRNRGFESAGHACPTAI
jgi:hypothetical protein